MKKKAIIIAIVLASFSPVQAQACSICASVEKALKATWDWLEYSRCLSQRIRYSQLTGKKLPPCDHGGKHDNPSK